MSEKVTQVNNEYMQLQANVSNVNDSNTFMTTDEQLNCSHKGSRKNTSNNDY